MVEVRTTKGTLEEVVAQHELPGDVPQAQRVTRLRVIAKRQRTGVGPGDKQVVLAAIDLHLVLIEHMPQVAGDQAQRQVFAVRPLQCVGRVGQVFLILGGVGVKHAVNRLRPQLSDAAPYLRQRLQQAAVAVALLIVGGLESGQWALHTGEVGKQIVETAVFAVDDHHILHVIVQGLVQLSWRQFAGDYRPRRFSGPTAGAQGRPGAQYGNPS